LLTRSAPQSFFARAGGIPTQSSPGSGAEPSGADTAASRFAATVRAGANSPEGCFDFPQLSLFDRKQRNQAALFLFVTCFIADVSTTTIVRDVDGGGALVALANDLSVKSA
jgi:hypothetical protein